MGGNLSTGENPRLLAEQQLTFYVMSHPSKVKIISKILELNSTWSNEIPVLARGPRELGVCERGVAACVSLYI